MTAAAIAGTFATYRHVPSRGVMQLVIEVPVESQAAAFEALGYPEPGKSLHVAVARLREEVMPIERVEHTAEPKFDTPPSSQTLGAGADNVVDGLRHAVRCPYLRQPREPCDCNPLDESKAIRSEDVLRIFKPLPLDEAAALRLYIDDGARVSSAANPLPPANPVAPEGDENRGNRAFKRAIMLCKDTEFQRWLCQDNEDDTAEVLRNHCWIASRKELKHNESARKRFEQLVTEFDLWRGRLPEVRG